MEPQVYQRMYQCKDSYWWFINHHFLIQRLIERFWSPGGGGKILDAGCGPSVMLRWLKEYSWVVGLDYSEQALDYCLRDRQTSLCRGSISCLPFKENAFNLIIISDVLYHKNVPDDEAALRQTYRSLKAGGIAVFHEPAFEILRRRHDIAEHTLRRYTASAFKSKIQGAGFRIKDVFYVNNFIFVPVLFVKIIESFLKRRKKAESDLVVFSPALNKALIFLATLESRLSTRVKFPFGVSVVCVASKG